MGESQDGALVVRPDSKGETEFHAAEVTWDMELLAHRNLGEGVRLTESTAVRPTDAPQRQKHSQ